MVLMTVLLSCQLIENMDLPPVVVFDVEEFAYVGVKFTLDASGSYDPEELATTFEWTLVNSPEDSTMNTARIENANLSTAYFTPDVIGTYSFKLIMKDITNTVEEYLEIEALAGAPATPEDFTVSTTSSNSISLAWAACDGAEGYRVYRLSSVTAEFDEEKYEGSETAFTDTGLTSGETYFYKVLSYNAIGTSALSAAISGIANDMPPPIPEGLTVGTVTENSAALSWTSALNAVSYELYRDVSPDGDFTTVVYDGSNLSYNDTGLSSSTLYYYRVLAENAAGKSGLSAAVSLSTLEATIPSAPSNFRLSSVTDNSASLAWDSVAIADSYQIYRDVSTSGTFSTKVYDGTALLYTDSGLASGSTYYYRAAASNENGSSELGSILTVSTSLAAPATPTGLAVGSVTQTSIALSWSLSSTATGYEVLRGTSTGSLNTLVYDGSLTSFIDNGLTSNTAYYYAVRAKNAGGSSALSGEVTATTLAEVPGAPAVSASDGSYTDRVYISWSTVTNATSYDVSYSTSSSGTYSTLASALTGTSYNHSAATPATTYYYKVRAYTSGGAGDWSNYDSGYRSPVAPGSVSASDGSSTAGSIVSWSSVSGADSYQIYRATSASGSYSYVATSSSTSYTDPGSYGYTYYYKVRTVDNGYVSAISTAYDSGWRAVPAPSGVAASDGTSTSYCQVSWAAISGVSSYKVYRSTSSGGTYSQIGTTSSSYFYDSTAEPGLTYYYKLSSYANGRDSVLSAYEWGYRKVVTPGGVTASDGTSSAVVVSWSAVTGADGYYIYRATTYNGSYSSIGSVTGTVTSYSDSSGSYSTNYYYKVTAYDNGRQSDLSAYNAGYRGIAAPSGLSASDGEKYSNIKISWTALSGAAGYYVYYSTSAYGSYTLLGTTTGTSYLWNPPSSQVVYYFKVRAYAVSGYPGIYSGYNSGWAWDEWASGLTGMYSFDNTWVDASSLGGTATLTPYNGAAFSTGRKLGTHSVYFDGINDYAKASSIDSFMSTDRKQLTVAFWVYARENTGSSTYVMNCSDFSIFQSGTNIGMAISLPSTNNAQTAVSLTTWTHVVATYDGSYIRIYVNGSLRSSTSWAGTVSDPNRVFHVGTSSLSPTTLNWFGNLDQIMIYNRVLNSGEIGALYRYDGSTN